MTGDMGRGILNPMNTVTASAIIILVVLVWGYFASMMVLSGDDQTSRETSTIPIGTIPLGILVVPYFSASSPEWKVIYKQAELYPSTIKYVIINPCSGPCVGALSTDWQDVISKLKSRGVKTLGYIFDNSQSTASIDYYMKIPAAKTDGIFFDNEGVKEDLDHFKQYADYVHSMGGVVYINPGFNYTHVTSYVTTGLADVSNLYEFEGNKSHHISLNCKVPSSRVSVILGNVSTVSEMQTAVEEAASKRIGVIYVYGESYRALPSYFTELVRKASNTYVNDSSMNCTG